MQMKHLCTDARTRTVAATKTTEMFGETYPEAQLRYDELEDQDKLPKLKIMPDEVRPEPYDGGHDDGFGGRTPRKYG